MIERIAIAGAVLVIASIVYWWWARRQGRVISADGSARLTSQDLGAPLGFHATLVQFSTPMCSKCPPTAKLLTQVVAPDKRLAHIEIDASERLDLARRFHVMRTPTVIVVDGHGSEVARMSGAPTAAQVHEALATVPQLGTDYAI